ncbi:MAG: M1 family metallopeptidase [Alphaproteobacteria bacterium]
MFESGLFRRSALLAVILLAACGPEEESSGQSAEAPQTSQAGEAAGDPATAPEIDVDALKDRAPKGRLPGTARPLAYTLDMNIDPRETEFSGTVTIAIELAEPASGIWLHGNGIAVSGAVVATADGAERPAAYAQILPSGVSRVAFGETLPAGKIELTLAYSAPFDKNLAGLFRVEEQGEAYALAKSESIQARKYLPGFDEPGFKAPFTISLTVPEGYVAISNAPVESRVAAGPGLETVRFAATRPMPTYLLSLAVGPFDVVERPPLPANEFREREVPLRGIARKGRGGDLNYVLDITRDFVEIFERDLGIPYPYKKLDIIAAPQWPSGATELSAAITYREQRILVGDEPAPGTRRSLIRVHAHEIAHMWFGNLVTPPWWDDLWLKEGFATWGTPLVLGQWEPEGGHELDAVARAMGAMRRDSLASARSVREPIDTNEDIRNAYTPIPYSKGMAVIRMVENYFGVDEFRRALGRYVQAHKDGAADSARFFETIGEVTGEPVLTKTFRSFVEQPGVPVIGTALDCGGAAPVVHLSQSRYRPVGSHIGRGGETYRWAVPVCLAWERDGERGRSCTILRERKAAHTLPEGACPSWLLPNAEGAGYYRWSLTPDGWDRLPANFPALEPGEALAAVDSAIAGFESGEARAAAMIAMIRKAAASPVRQVAASPLGTLERYVRILEGQGGGKLKAFARRLYGPRLGALDTPQTEDDRLLKTELQRFLALTADDPGLRTELAARAARFIGLEGERDASALNSDEYEMALTAGVQDRGAPFLDRLIEARTTIDDPRFDAASAKAIGRAREPALAARARAYALSGEPGAREAYAILEAQMEDAKTRDAAWAWLQQNIEAVTRTIPSQWRRRLPTLADGFCETERIGELRTFFGENAALMPGHGRQLSRAIEEIELCAAFRRELAAELLEAL